MALYSGEMLGAALESASVEEAIYALLLCAVTVDGSAQMVEQEEFDVLIRRSRTLAPSIAQHRAWKEKYLGMIQSEAGFNIPGIKVLAQHAAAKVPEELRVSIFAQACDLTFTDAQFAAEEQWLIRMLAVAFDLPFEQVRSIVEVLSWKNAY